MTCAAWGRRPAEDRNLLSGFNLKTRVLGRTLVKDLVRPLVPERLLAWRSTRAWARPDPPEFVAASPPDLSPFEYSLHSQNGEDGVLRHIFHAIGFRSRRFVEFGFGYTENNCLRLVLKEGFEGAFVDGDAKAVRMMTRALRIRKLDAKVRAVAARLDRDNVNEVISRASPDPDLDVLSIDVDGNDYWLWQSLDVVRPRVVVIEYNATFGPARAITVPYDPDFDYRRKHPSGYYHGASLGALCQLASSRGYALVGCESQGINAFFVRRTDLGKLKEVTAAEAYRPHAGLLGLGISTESQMAAIKDMPYVDVGRGSPPL